MTRWYGGLMNRVAEGDPNPPRVGEGATELMYSDRHAYTVAWVSPSGKTARVQRDRAVMKAGSCQSEHQEYEFTPNPNAPLITVRRTKRGWTHGSSGFAFGYRSEYCDPSF